MTTHTPKRTQTPPQPPKKQRRPPTNKDDRPNDNDDANDDERPQTNHHHPPRLTNDGQHSPTDTPQYEIRCPVASKRRTMTHVVVHRCCAFYDAMVSTPVPRSYQPPSLTMAATWQRQTTCTTNERPAAPRMNGDKGPRPPPKNYERPAARTVTSAQDYETQTRTVMTAQQNHPRRTATTACTTTL
jgi:hypothetical protein